MVILNRHFWLRFWSIQSIVNDRVCFVFSEYLEPLQTAWIIFKCVKLLDVIGQLSSFLHLFCFSVLRRMRPRTRCRCRTWRQCLDRPCCVLQWKGPRCRPWRNCFRPGLATLWYRRQYWWRSLTFARREHSCEVPDTYILCFVNLTVM